MSTILLETLACAVAYLIGSIPFGYLIAKGVAGIDIRTVGSGNIGATNVGRTLGFRFFLIVFLLDAGKGFLPTFFLPRLVSQVVGHAVLDLSPLLALAAILGHNYPIFLRFKGGKGVATTLGAVTALDPIASAGAVVGFVIFVLLTRFVSLASLGGALVFVAVYVTQHPEPFARDSRVLSVLTFTMLFLLFYRHRKNLGRIAAGTEPKVSLRKKRPTEGKIHVGLIFVLVAVAAGSALALNAARRPELVVGGRRITEVSRLATGHQRAERPIFLDGGKMLAVTCPRYMRVVLASVTASPGLELIRDIKLEGRPVALAAAKDRFYVLQRPHGDARHMEEAWWETFDFDGRPIGSRVRIGWDPDDMAISADERYAYVLTSGLAEGETNRPAPALICFDLTSSPPKAVGRVSFDLPKDDPERLLLLPNGRAAVSLRGTNAIARIDLADPTSPKLIDRIEAPSPLVPDAITLTKDGRLLVGDPDAHAYWRQAGDALIRVDVEGGAADLVEAEGLVFVTLPKGSGVAVLSAEAHVPLGTLSLRGTANLATTRPLGIAYSPERRLIAVSNRAGGSVHLIAVE